MQSSSIGGALALEIERYCVAVPQWRSALFFGLITVGVSLLLYGPALWLPPPGRYEDFIKLCAHPLARNLHEPITEFRLTTPLIAHVLGLHGEWALLVQYAANVGTFALLFSLLRRRFGPPQGLLWTMGLALTQVAQVSNVWWGVPDAVTNLCIVIAMSVQAPLLLAAAALAGTCNDERFLVALPLIFVWHWGNGNEVNLRRVLVGLVMGIAAAFVVRAGLVQGWWGPPADAQVDHSVIRQYILAEERHPWSLLTTPVGWFFGFRWLWLLPAWALASRQVPSLKRLALAGALAIALVPVFLVADSSRSSAIAFPAFVLVLYWLQGTVPDRLRQWAGWVLLACTLTPQANVVGTQLQWLRPLPVSVLRAIRIHMTPRRSG
ncbi:MAG: hypothetical protein ACYC6M_03290 [Terriglobales bacterium]